MASELTDDLQPTATEVAALHSKQKEKRVGLDVNSRSTVTAGITDISEYLSNESNVLEALCAAPTSLALKLLESTLTEQQLQCFMHCYEKGQYYVNTLIELIILFWRQEIALRDRFVAEYSTYQWPQGIQ